MTAWNAPTWDRTARRVRRARLRLPPGASSHRLSSLLEEALRLPVLPGENEGRVYYFRRLHVRGLPSSGDRSAWLKGFQDSLEQQAEVAVWAQDPESRSSPAVYFQSEVEVLEILLARLLEGRAADEWFWPLAGPQGRGADDLPAIIEALRESPASWTAVAAVVCASPAIDPVRLLESIPGSRAQAWVRELDGGAFRPTVPTGFAFPKSSRELVGRALRVFGEQDVRVVWLAALAVLLACPGDLAARTAVWRARLALRQMARWNPAAPPELAGSFESRQGPSGGASIQPRTDTGIVRVQRPDDSSAPHTPTGGEPIFLRDASTGKPVGQRREFGSQVDELRSPGRVANPDPGDALATSSIPTGQAGTPPAVTTPTTTVLRATPESPQTGVGVRTSAAGLCFLLNALQQIELPAALAAGLAGIHPDFPPRLLARLAEHAGIDEQDPLVVWVRSLLLNPADPEIAVRPASWWPANLRASGKPASLDHLLRAWAVSTRRWCWRTGRINVRDIVARAGVFSVNRTDLDVALPLDTADVRIRRIGLDLDPGWLPWFGRVVRFHYPGRRELYG